MAIICPDSKQSASNCSGVGLMVNVLQGRKTFSLGVAEYARIKHFIYLINLALPKPALYHQLISLTEWDEYNILCSHTVVTNDEFKNELNFSHLFPNFFEEFCDNT